MPAVVVAPSRAALTSFIGRRAEIARLRVLLSESRLLTITGAGGIGKTRLAEEFVKGAARTLDGRIAVAYLANASTGADVYEIVAGSMGLRSRALGELQSQLVAYARERRLLLVVDNCEHVAEQAASLACALLESCPSLRILATSRRPLHVPGEQVFPIDGLSTDAAIELFAQRAVSTSPSFILDSTTSAQVAQICRYLDTMPLAIELAAAQVRSVGLTALAALVAEHAAALGSRSTVGPERQRTLRRTVEWSYALLTERQQIVWRRLAIFAGGFTLRAAKGVVAVDPISPDELPTVLGDLVDHSMLMYEAGVDRYRLIEVLRECARERLDETIDAVLIAERHAEWVASFVTECDARWLAGDQPGILATLDAEGGNMRVALDYCRRSDRALCGLRIVSGAFFFWLTRATLTEGARWFAAFLGRSGDAALEARAHWRAGYIATLRLDFPTAKACCARCVEFGDAAGSAIDSAYGAGIAGLTLLYEYPDRAEDARQIARIFAQHPAVDTMGHCWGRVLYSLASLALRDLDEARRASMEVTSVSRASRDLWTLELGLRFLGHAEWLTGHRSAAREALLECLRIDREMHDAWHMAWSVEALGWVSAEDGANARAARLLGIARNVWAQTGSELAAPWRGWHDAALAQLRERLGPERLAVELEAGNELDRDAALAYALDEHPSAIAPVTACGELTARETEVAGLIAGGLSNRGIGEKLFLSTRTVEKHVENVMNKLGVDSRAEIAAWHARRNRL